MKSSTPARPQKSRLTSLNALIVCSLTAILGLIVSTWLAFHQPANPGNDNASRSWPRWWLHPHEQNAFLRDPAIAAPLQSIPIASSSRLVVLNPEGALISKDGARGWNEIRFTDSGDPIVASSFANANIGYAVTNTGRLFKTNDGAQTWTLMPQIPHKFSARASDEVAMDDLKSLENTNQIIKLAFTTPDQGILTISEGVGGKQSFIFETSNGAKTWSEVEVSNGGKYPAFLITPSISGDAVISVRRTGEIVDLMTRVTLGTAPALPSNANYTAICFVDQRHGWLADSTGNIFTTAKDSAWSESMSGTGDSINALISSDSDHVWAVGNSGNIFATIDGGRNWAVQISKTTANLIDGKFLNATDGWIVGDDGTLLETKDGGNTWHALTRGKRQYFTDLYTNNTNNAIGWIASFDGTLYKTEDYGVTWESVLTQTHDDFFSVGFSDENHGIALDYLGNGVFSTDAGRSWKPLYISPHGYASANSQLAFLTRNTVFANIGGTVMLSSDGGQRWKPTEQLPSDPNHACTRFSFVDANRGWIICSGSEIWGTTNGGTSWKRQATIDAESLSDINFFGANNGAVVGRNGGIYVTNDGGTTWPKTNPVGAPELLALTFSSETLGWAVGKSGTILATADGGRKWVKQLSGTKVDLGAVRFFTREEGCAVGDSTVICTRDGGQTWRSVEYMKRPAPWLYASWVVILLCAWGAYRGLRSWSMTVDDADYAPSIAGTLSSDSPLKKGDYDALNYREIALGISRFLRNNRTTPSLTIAITGEWGVGKSTVMNMLKEEMETHKVATVTFNAWHHQAEASMLATLLDAVREHGAPEIWTPWLWVRFHLKLLWQRWLEHPIAGVILSFTIGFAVLSTLSAPDHITGEEIKNAFFAIGNYATGKETTKNTLEKLNIHLVLIPALLVSIAFIWNALRKVPEFLMAFPLSPAALLATVSGDFSVREAEKQSGFRNTFAKHFDTVTSALAPRWMVIFIDDLDRCYPNKAMEILEAVNYLVSNGKCFIVLGIARERVERLIGLANERLAKETSATLKHDRNGNNIKSEDVEKSRRRHYAKQYLEKLINIEVPIPTVAPELWANMIRPKVSDTTYNSFDRILVWLHANRRKILTPLVGVCGVGIALWLAPYSGQTNSVYLEPTVAHAATSPPPASPASAVSTPTLDVKVKHRTSEEYKSSLVQTSTQAQSWSSVIVLSVFAATILAMVVFHLVRRETERYVLEDSDAFSSALGIWQPLVTALNPSPRAWKRFVNRTRYLAMRAHVREDNPRRPTELIRDALMRPFAKTRTNQIASIYPEAWTVSMAAIQCIDANALSWPPIFSERLKGVRTASNGAEASNPPAGPPKNNGRGRDVSEWFHELATGKRPSDITASELDRFVSSTYTESLRTSARTGSIDPARIRYAILNVLAEHIERGGSWPPTEEFATLFRTWMEGFADKEVTTDGHPTPDQVSPKCDDGT